MNKVFLGDSSAPRARKNSAFVSRNEECELVRRWQGAGDEQALSRLLIGFQPLAKSLARKFGTPKHPFEELVQEANVGLVQAAAKFDPDRGCRFSTYAYYWIRARIFDFVCNNHSVVRVFKGDGAKHAFFSLERIRRQVDGQSMNEGSVIADSGMI